MRAKVTSRKQFRLTRNVTSNCDARRPSHGFWTNDYRAIPPAGHLKRLKKKSGQWTEQDLRQQSDVMEEVGDDDANLYELLQFSPLLEP